MKEMILDTSSSILFINFVIDGEIKYSVQSMGKNNHSDNLLKDIEKGLKEINLSVKDFDRIVCGYGPGMYTGLRVSMTVAKMFCWTLNKPLYVLSSIDLLTSAYLKKDGKYKVMLKAKKDYSYTKVFMVEKGEYSIIREEEFMDNESFNNLFSNDEYTLINNDNIDINYLNIDESKLMKIENIHALEPNYLRSDI